MMRMTRLVVLGMGLALAPAASAAKSRRQRQVQAYNPSEYLLKRQADKKASDQIKTAPSAPVVTIGQRAGVICDPMSTTEAQPKVGGSGKNKSCAEGDPSCDAAIQHEANAAANKASMPSATELADQVLGLIKDHCRPVAGEQKGGFSPSVELSVTPSNANGQGTSGHPQVSAAVGINGTF